MGILKHVVRLAIVGAATAAVAGKVVRDKQKKEELDEFLVPSQDDPVLYDVPKEKEQSLKEAIQSLENHEPRSVQFTFYVPEESSVSDFQAALANFDLSSSLDEDPSKVVVEYNGNFDLDDLDLLLTQLSECCLQYSAVFIAQD